MIDIDPFPSKLRREKKPGPPYALTDEQADWLRRYFPVIADRILCKMMGCSYLTLRRMAQRLGITKDRNAIRERYSQIMKEVIKSERRRDHWGLPRRTSLYLPYKKYTASQIKRRYVAVHKFNYILADDCSDEGGHRSAHGNGHHTAYRGGGRQHTYHHRHYQGWVEEYVDGHYLRY